MTLDTVLGALWVLLLDALDGEDPKKVYALAAAWGLLIEVCSNADHRLAFDTADDLVRMTVRRLLGMAATDFAAGEDAYGQAIADAVFRLVEATGISVGG